MKVFALTVGRNEEHRYLKPMLEHTACLVDEHFFYDDWSDDRTAFIAVEAGAKVIERPAEGPAFVQDEGMFRGAAWKAFEQFCEPEEGDWVIVIDCDEVIISPVSISNGILRQVCEEADPYVVAIDIAFDEVFGYEDRQPLVRVDRLWGTIHAPRLFRYQPGGQYMYGALGALAVPTYAQAGPWGNTEAIRIMHYGYATVEDQKIKYQRYAGRVGHSNAHVESIMATDKVLERYKWPYLEEMRSQWTTSQ